MAKPSPGRGNFVTPGGNAKSAAIAQIVRIARKERLTYDEFIYCCRRARRALGLHKPKAIQTLPRLLSDADLKRFFTTIQSCGVLQHEIMLKLLFFTAVRVSELVHIRVADVDTAQCKIFIDQGKGSERSHRLKAGASV
jgi:integrase/recombinase XerD